MGDVVFAHQQNHETAADSDQAFWAPLRESQTTKSHQPFLILHVADYPERGAVLQATVLTHYLEMAKVAAQLHGAPGKTHVSLNDEIGLPDDEPSRAIVDFVAVLTSSKRS